MQSVKRRYAQRAPESAAQAVRRKSVKICSARTMRACARAADAERSGDGADIRLLDSAMLRVDAAVYTMICRHAYLRADVLLGANHFMKRTRARAQNSGAMPRDLMLRQTVRFVEFVRPIRVCFENRCGAHGNVRERYAEGDLWRPRRRLCRRRVAAAVREAREACAEAASSVVTRRERRDGGSRQQRAVRRCAVAIEQHYHEQPATCRPRSGESDAKDPSWRHEHEVRYCSVLPQTCNPADG